ncbi:hypothetical protein FRC12_003443 [Ceratobasidium sp. 428]|nr:hypothetical protein FRC12_003443 [Ceratobasidium sp. 428]
MCPSVKSTGKDLTGRAHPPESQAPDPVQPTDAEPVTELVTEPESNSKRLPNGPQQSGKRKRPTVLKYDDEGTTDEGPPGIRLKPPPRKRGRKGKFFFHLCQYIR